MTKFYISSLTFLIILFTSWESKSQCVVCVDAPSLITCGETDTLVGDGYVTSGFSDDFNIGIGPLWASITTGGSTSTICTSAPTMGTSNCATVGGVIPAGNYLWFPHGSLIPRQATTVGIPVPAGGTIIFEYKMEGQGGSCDGPDLAAEGTMLQYSTNNGITWIDMPANFFPFNLNPAPYTNIAYFSPLNPQLQTFNSWTQYSIPIPAAAWGPSTRFRWSQTSASSTNFDFWGLENVNIQTISVGGAGYTWTDLSTGITTIGPTLSINPTSITSYEFTYTNSGLSCSTTVAVDVAPPIVNPTIVPNPSNPCPSAVDLDANMSFNSCNYNVYLYDDGGDGWVQVPQTPQSIDNRLEVYINGTLHSTITMNDLSGTPNPHGPVVYSFPVTAGGTFETIFLSGGPNPNECAYFIEDNQGNLINAQGLVSSPNSPWWPVPNGYQFGVFNGFLAMPGNVGPIVTTCPTTNPYSYSWSIVPGGSTAGIGSPNSQSTTVTTATTQTYEVVAVDINTPGCTASDTIQVQGSGGNWDFSTIAPNPACEGDCIDLNFTSTVNSGNFNIIIEMIDANGVSSSMFTIDNNGNNIATGSPINLCPTISTAVSSASFNITSLVDISDPNSCEIPITNANQTVNFSTNPNAGTGPLIPETFCTLDAITDISTFLSNSPDPGGTWTYSGTGSSPLNMPFVGLNYMFDPSSYPAGDYIYTVSNSPCLNDIASITINLEIPPNAGQLPPVPVNMCMGQILDLNNQFTVLPTPNTPVWTDITSGIPGNNVSNNFNPNNTGNYIFRSTISATTNCPSDYEDITISVNDLPTVTFSTTNQICLGESLDLGFVVTGVAPFTITITDNVNPPFNVIVDANGNDNATGNPITATPGNIGITNYTVTNISDNFCSTSVSGQNSAVNVLTPPNSGALISPLSVCSNDLNIYDLSNQLSGQDLNGYWIDANGFQQPPNASFNFNVSMLAGDHTYIVTSGACPDAQTIVPVTIIAAPNTGFANPQNICINDYGVGNLFNLDNLLSGSPDPGTWYQSGIPVPTNINPNTYGTGITTFTYQVNGIPPCANSTIDVNLTINPEPAVGSFTSSAPSTTQGYSIGINVSMLVGTPPFTIDIYDDDSPLNTGSIFIASGMSGSTNMMPSVIPTTTYAINLITDGNGCTTNYVTTVPVAVVPYPILNSFTAVNPEICEGDIATIEFDMTQGVFPVTVNYLINGTPYSEILNGVGTTVVNIPNSNLNFGMNTFSISSIIDINNQAAPNIPNDIQIIYNPQPSATFSTNTPLICYKDDAILEFDFLAGTPPFTVNYRDNGTIIIPSLVFNNLGTQTNILSPNPSVGNHSYDIINIVDAKGCINTINNTEDIFVRELPDLDITINGKNPICFGENSEISFPVLAGLAPFNLNLLEGSSNTTLNIDASGLIGGNPYQVSPPTTSIYTLTSVTDANGCMQSLTDSKTLTVNELPIVDISGTTEICNGDMTNIYFDFSSGLAPWTLFYDINGTVATPFSLNNISDSISISPTTTSVYTYTSILDANLCSTNFVDAATITVNQLPEVEVSGGGEICDDGSTVDIIFNTSNGTPTFNLEYTVGINNQLVSNVGYQHVITTNEVGTYKVTNIVDSKGCIGQSIIGSADVTVNPVPVADFNAYPQPADITNPVIHFIDNSINHTTGTWDFDDNSTAATNFGEITHRFSDLDSGTYYVELYVESNKGCWDIQTQKIIIDKAFIFYIPNAFTPNNDMTNDIFMPYVDGVNEYDFYIYSRLGQEIFHTNDINEGWDGYVYGGEKHAISGKYAYTINIVDLHGKERKYQGSFLLIR